ncbi:MAG: hypothetical protein O7D30_06335, partial [Rickettsia endosymbiont of Ixodes persulcatus]|nr:hypothetical protein [Rickettsia endosymbiont of Ixodes persulcatus]
HAHVDDCFVPFFSKNGSLHVLGTDGGCHSCFDSLAAFRATIACDVYTVRKLEGRTLMLMTVLFRFFQKMDHCMCLAPTGGAILVSTP